MHTPMATTAKPMIAELTAGNDKKPIEGAAEIAFLDLLTDGDPAGDDADRLASARVGETQGTRAMAGQDPGLLDVLRTVERPQPLLVAQGTSRQTEENQAISDGPEIPLAQAILSQGQASAVNAEYTARAKSVKPGQRVGQKNGWAQPVEYENAALAHGGYPPGPAMPDVLVSAQPAHAGRSGVQSLEATGIPAASSVALQIAGVGMTLGPIPGRGPEQMRIGDPGAMAEVAAERTPGPKVEGTFARLDVSPALQPGLQSPPDRPPSASPHGQESMAARDGLLPSGTALPARFDPPGTPVSIPPENSGPASRALGIPLSTQEPTGHQMVKETVGTGQIYATRTPQAGLSPDGPVASAQQKVGWTITAGDPAPPQMSGPGKPQPGTGQGSQPFSKPLPAASEVVTDRPPGRPAVSSPPQPGAAQEEASLLRPVGPLPAGPDPVAATQTAQAPGKGRPGAQLRTETTETKAPVLSENTVLSPRSGAFAETKTGAVPPLADNRAVPQPEPALSDPMRASLQSRGEGRADTREAQPVTRPPAVEQKAKPEFSARDRPLVLPGDDTEDSLTARLDATQGARGHSIQISPSSPASEPALARHVAAQIAELARRPANGPVELVLSPEELGRVRLVMTMDHGALNVAVAAERAETQDLMRRHIETLAQDLRAVGYRDVSFSFGSGDGAQNRSGPGAERSASAQPGAPMRPEHEASTSPSPEAAPPDLAATPGRVDIRL